MTTDQRAERVALNESRFREINEGLRRDLDKLPEEPEIVPFVCECGMASCAGTLELTLPEYESVRANSRRFVVLPGHEIAGTEHVIDEGHRYTVVEKTPEVGPIVDAADPRRQAP